MSYCYGVGGVTEVSSGSGPSVRMVRIVHHELDTRCRHGPPKGGGAKFCPYVRSDQMTRVAKEDSCRSRKMCASAVVLPQTAFEYVEADSTPPRLQVLVHTRSNA